MTVRPPWLVLRIATMTLAAIGAVRHPARGDDWPQWRGPRRDGVSLETGLLLSWPDGGPQAAWQFTGVGSGYSSVVIGRGRVFTIGRRDPDVVVTALDETTHVPLWTQKIGETSRNPCSTPTLDGDRLYALDPDGDLACLNAESGEVLWHKNLVDDFGGRMMSGRGYGESPLIDGDKLICTPGGPQAALVAVDKRSGALVWKAELPEIGPAGREGAGFSSVVVTEAAGLRQYVQLVGRGVVGVDARDGRFLWGYNGIANETVNIPTPVVHDDFVFSANGYTAGSVLLKLAPDGTPGATSEKVKAEVAFALTAGQFQNHHGGVVRLGNYIYGGHGNNNGLPTCLDLATGRVVWKRRGPGVGSAAVLFADKRFYFRYQNGLVALIEASERGYSLKGTLQVPGAGGDSWAHPVVANGHLFLREQEALWVYDVRLANAARPSAAPATTAPIDHPAVAALRQRGVSIERLFGALPRSLTKEESRGATRTAPRTAAEKGRRLYELIMDSAGKKPTDPPLFVVFTDAHLTSAGAIADDLVDLLKEFPGPVVLNLAGTAVSDAGLRGLQSLSNLAGLNLELCQHFTDAGMEHLASLPSLQVLILAGAGVTHDGVRLLAASPSIVALDLEVCDGITDAACEPLGAMRQLKALILKKTGFEKKQITNDGLQKLKRLSSLEALNLYGTGVTDAGLDHLKSFEKLRDLNLSLLAITDAGLTHLQSLTTLEHLELLYSVGFSGPTITNAGIDSLKPLANLRSLNLTGSKLTDAGLDRLKGLMQLTTLQIVHTGVSADGAKAFQAAVPECEIVR